MDLQPNADAAKKIQMRKDKRMARDDPARYCADRWCVHRIIILGFGSGIFCSHLVCLYCSSAHPPLPISVSTGNCQVWEDMFEMAADEVQKFCKVRSTVWHRWLQRNPLDSGG